MWALRVAFVVFILALAVQGDGPSCSQNSLGPADMMMSNGNMNPKYMWHKTHGVVRIPVVLDHEYDHHERGVIFGGLAELAQKTCIKFYVYKHPHAVHDGDYVYITKSKGKGCWSYVGKQGGHQDLSLPRGCINHRTVMHEMMHALGFSHEHVRADRDKYVAILWENIQRGRERNFARKHDSKSDNFGPYDYDSIMHYDQRAFSSNGHDTIRPLRGYVRIGKGKRMSHWDASKINKAYKCHGGKGGYGGNGLYGFGHSPEQSQSPAGGLSFAPDQSFRSNPFFPSPHDHNGHDGPGPDHHNDNEDYSPSLGPGPFGGGDPSHDHEDGPPHPHGPSHGHPTFGGGGGDPSHDHEDGPPHPHDPSHGPPHGPSGPGPYNYDDDYYP